MGLLVRDKWQTYYMEDHEEDAALRLVTERVDQGFWYDGAALEIATKIIQERRGDDALFFLLGRAEHEYEYVEVQDAR
jgi:hypothetical protein